MDRKKILVVDDEENIVKILKTRLESKNYLVCTAYDGLEAIQKVKTEKPNLIILDILMPRMDGASFLHEMKKQKLMTNIPIIVLTAKASMKDFFLVNGAVQFLVKPFDSRLLLGEIEKHLCLQDETAASA